MVSIGDGGFFFWFAFKVGICLGFLVGFVIAVMVTHVYRDYREDKLKS